MAVHVVNLDPTTSSLISDDCQEREDPPPNGDILKWNIADPLDINNPEIIQPRDTRLMSEEEKELTIVGNRIRRWEVKYFYNRVTIDTGRQAKANYSSIPAGLFCKLASEATSLDLVAFINKRDSMFYLCDRFMISIPVLAVPMKCGDQLNKKMLFFKLRGLLWKVKLAEHKTALNQIINRLNKRISRKY
jgi:hypothetical protein